MTDAQRFYSQPAPHPVTRQDVLDGRIIKLNPALITITDGLVATSEAPVLQDQVYAHVRALLGHGIRTFHADINFPDYQGYGPHRPDINTGVFTPAFLARLNDLVRTHQAFLNLHLLTAEPLQQLRAFAHIPLGAICFQLDAVATSQQLAILVDRIWQAGACVSPVIETIGSGRAPVLTPEAVVARLEPVVGRIGMLTVQGGRHRCAVESGGSTGWLCARAGLYPAHASDLPWDMADPGRDYDAYDRGGGADWGRVPGRGNRAVSSSAGTRAS